MGKHSKPADEDPFAGYLFWNYTGGTRKQRVWRALKPYAIWITLYLGLAILGLLALLIHPEYPPCTYS